MLYIIKTGQGGHGGSYLTEGKIEVIVKVF